MSLSTTPADWDAEEREALAGLEDDLAAIRRRHTSDPLPHLVRAARAGVLPGDVEARIASYVEATAWGRAIAAGLQAHEPDADALDGVTEARILARVTHGAGASRHASATRRPAYVAMGGLAVAATVLVAVMVTRGPLQPSAEPAAAGPASPGPALVEPPPPATPAPQARPPIAPFTKPDVTLSTDALSWRGAAADDSFLADLTPAINAYRDGDYPRASAAFDRLSIRYPGSVDVQFYRGVTRMLLGDFAGAIDPLAAAVRAQNEVFTEDALWFLAVAEERSGRDSASRARLSDLCLGGGRRAADACAALAATPAQAPPKQQ